MKKNLSINTSSRNKSSDIETLEREFKDKPSDSDDQVYRFTAVLPESIGRELRVYCAWRNLKLKDVFAEAVVDFLDKKRTYPSSGEKQS